MKKVIFTSLFIFITFLQAFALLPNSIRIKVQDLNGNGQPDYLILQKRSLRSDDFSIRLYEKSKGYYDYTGPIPQVRTYRGYVESDPDIQVNVSIDPGNILQAYTTTGRNIINYIEDFPIEEPIADDGTEVKSQLIEKEWTEDRISPTETGDIIPTYIMRKLYYGIVCIDDYYQEMGSIENTIARVEQRFNDFDQVYARDIAMCAEIRQIVIFIDGDKQVNFKDYWRNDPTAPYVNDLVRMKLAGGGGSGGRVFDPEDPSALTHFCTVGRTVAYSRSLVHEVGHGYGAGHHMAPCDHMQGSESSCGTQTAQRQISASNHALPETTPAVIYDSPLHPHARWDFTNTFKNTPVEVNLIQNDYDGNGDKLRIEWIETITKNGGKIEIIDNETIKYTPAENFLGIDYANYYVEDETGLTNRNGRLKVKVSNGDLMNYYNFDFNDGSSYSDLGPANNRLFLNAEDADINDMIVDGKSGKGVLENDKFKHCRLESSAGDPIFGSLSVSIWAKCNKTGTNPSIIISKGVMPQENVIRNPHGGWAIVANDEGGFTFYGNSHALYYLTPDDEKFDRKTENNFIETDKWYHLVLVLDRDKHEIRSYINNQAVENSEMGSYLYDHIIESYLPLQLFSVCSNDEDGYNFTLDELKIYDKVLSEKEIEELYNLNITSGAGNPFPKNLSKNGVENQSISWSPSIENQYTYNLYVGSSYENVLNAKINDDEFKSNLTQNSYTLNNKVNENVFWRIDQVDKITNEIITGEVWTFKTNAIGLFDKLNNYSFENEVVKPQRDRNGIQGGGWNCIKNSKTLTFYDGFDANFPTTPYGDNWVIIKNGDKISQKLGYCETDKNYKLKFYVGKEKNTTFSGANVNIWIGGADDLIESTLTCEQIGAIKAHSTFLEPSILESEDAKDYVLEFTISSDIDGVKNGDVMYIEFASLENGFVMIDHVEPLYSPVIDFKSSLNNASPNTVIKFEECTQFKPKSFQWLFEGGTPSTSEDLNPEILYKQKGEFDVTLTCSNDFGTSTLKKEKYIIIEGSTDIIETKVGDLKLIFDEAKNLTVKTSDDEKITDFQIYNVTGSLLFSQKKCSSSFIVPSSIFQKSSLYILVITTNHNQYTRKIVC